MRRVLAPAEVRVRTQTSGRPVSGAHPSRKLTFAGFHESWPSALVLSLQLTW